MSCDRHPTHLPYMHPLTTPSRNSTPEPQSAKEVLAELFVLDTYERSKIHKELNGTLPRFIRKDVDGTRR